MVIILAALVPAYFTGYSQCDKKVILTASLTEYLDSNDVVQHAEPEKTIITIDRSTIRVAPGDKKEMNGTITENTCNWTIPYKEGQSVLKADIPNESGDIRHSTIHLENKAGKIVFELQAEEMPGIKIRVNVDSFEEAK